jgi:ABC-type nickel/cobalt efflux system permease component RcnA
MRRACGCSARRPRSFERGRPVDFLFAPVDAVDAWLTGLFDGAPLLVALGIAFLLGLRHASDPDHLVAVTSLVAAEEGDTRKAARLGAWWGIGHAGALLAIGIPLIAFKAELPAWLEEGAEKAIGLVIVTLAARVIYKWARGDYRASAHYHDGGHRRRRHLRKGVYGHRHVKVRTRGQAVSIGLLHGLAGTGAVVLLLIAALPTRLEAGLALAVFAPMSIASMAACTAAFAWVLTRPIVEPIYRTVLIPGVGVFGVTFGLWYAGLA